MAKRNGKDKDTLRKREPRQKRSDHLKRSEKSKDLSTCSSMSRNDSSPVEQKQDDLSATSQKVQKGSQGPPPCRHKNGKLIPKRFRLLEQLKCSKESEGCSAKKRMTNDSTERSHIAQDGSQGQGPPPRKLTKVSYSPPASTKPTQPSPAFAFSTLSGDLEWLGWNLMNANSTADPDPPPSSGCAPDPGPPPPSDIPFSAADLKQFATVREMMNQASVRPTNSPTVEAVIVGSTMTVDIIHPVYGLPNNTKFLLNLVFMDFLAPAWDPKNAASVGIRSVTNFEPSSTPITGYVCIESFSFKYEVIEDVLSIRIPKNQPDLLDKDKRLKEVYIKKFPLGEDRSQDCALSLEFIIDGRQMELGFTFLLRNMDYEFVFSTEDFITIKVPLS